MADDLKGLFGGQIIKTEETKKIAVITGATGQDASYLAELLLERNYIVVGVHRRKSLDNFQRIEHLFSNENFILENGDVTDESFLTRLLQKYNVSEFYSLAAMSFVKESWNTPIQTFEINIMGPLKCLEAIRHTSPQTRFYQASSSEIFGNTMTSPQTEESYPIPKSPYGISKLTSYWITRNYRESYGLFACNGILYNHESQRRGIEFVTRKITDGVAKIKLGLADKLVLGNLESRRDWGHSKDYVYAMWLMMQQERPDDYVIATGETHSIKEFVEEAFKYVGIEDWQKYVKQDEKYMRPVEVDYLCGDYTKAKEKLGWEPKIKFKELIRIMMDADLERLRNWRQN